MGKSAETGQQLDDELFPSMFDICGDEALLFLGTVQRLKARHSLVNHLEPSGPRFGCSSASTRKHYINTHFLRARIFELLIHSQIKRGYLQTPIKAIHKRHKSSKSGKPKSTRQSK